ncbi:MAG: hypothetical protein H0Z24_06910 [Thermosipho sp. (in: Bacteria)]|nr:hypothetical protein [Thermosipho sp. (in: thermotogales)]
MDKKKIINNFFNELERMSSKELYNHLISKGINVVSYSNQEKGKIKLYNSNIVTIEKTNNN